VIAVALALATHVPTWIYAGYEGYNAAWSSTRTAALATFAEFSEYDLERLTAYKRAGGAHAFVYIDPSLVPYCVPPFRSPAGKCSGPFGTPSPPESAWFHQSNGERARRSDSYTHQYQEYLNPATSAARTAVRRHTSEIALQAPVDGFYADDTGSSLTGPDGTTANGIFYGFEAPGVEIRTDAAWRAAEQALIAAIPLQVVLNGGDATTWLPAYGGAFLTMPQVVGASREGCFSTQAAGPMTSVEHRWQRTADALLAITAVGRYAICMETGRPSQHIRLYDFASWLMTYAAPHSVLSPLWDTPNRHNVYAEINLVPIAPGAQPKSSASLQSDGLYVRAFARCAAGASDIGTCVAIVNPSARAQRWPSLGRNLHWSLELDDASLDDGGTIRWRPLNSRTLPPASAALVSERRPTRAF
jgi:hypothetical protein